MRYLLIILPLLLHSELIRINQSSDTSIDTSIKLDLWVSEPSKVYTIWIHTFDFAIPPSRYDTISLYYQYRF